EPAEVFEPIAYLAPIEESNAEPDEHSEIVDEPPPELAAEPDATEVDEPSDPRRSVEWSSEPVWSEPEPAPAMPDPVGRLSAMFDELIASPPTAHRPAPEPAFEYLPPAEPIDETPPEPPAIEEPPPIRRRSRAATLLDVFRSSRSSGRSEEEEAAPESPAD